HMIAVDPTRVSAHGHALEAEELLLEADARARVAREIPRAPDHPMTGDDDGQRIVPQGLSDRAHGFRRADALGDATVGRHGSVRYLRGSLEHPAPELAPRPAKIEGPAEMRVASLQIVEQLTVERLHHGRVFDDVLVAGE